MLAIFVCKEKSEEIVCMLAAFLCKEKFNAPPARTHVATTPTQPHNHKTTRVSDEQASATV